MSSTLRERLYAKLDRKPSGCWEFTGSKNKAGYGNIFIRCERLPGGRRRNIATCAHRASYEIHIGPIPDGQNVLHRCDNPPCCNPDHLFVGTQGDNMQDKSAKGRAVPGPVSRTEWWTPAIRAARAAEYAARNQAAREAAAIAAGHPPDWKLCPACDRWLPRSSYNANRARPDGIQAHCKACKHAADDARRARKTERRCSVARSDKVYF